MELEKQIEHKENFMNNVAIVQDNKGNIIYNKDNIQNLTKNHLDMAYFIATKEGGAAFQKGENGHYKSMKLEAQKSQTLLSRLTSFLYSNQKNTITTELAKISLPNKGPTDRYNGGFNYSDHKDNGYIKIIAPVKRKPSYPIRMYNRIKNYFSKTVTPSQLFDESAPLTDSSRYHNHITDVRTFIDKHNELEHKTEGKIEFNIDKSSIKSAQIGDLKTTCPDTIKQKLDEHASLKEDVKGPEIKIELHGGAKHSVRPGFALVKPEKPETKSSSSPSSGPQ